MRASVAALEELAALARPVTAAETRVMEVPAPLAALFPEGGIRRGATLAIEPLAGGSSLALSLAAAVTSGGRWAAAVGLPSLGLLAAAELGVDLGRLALVPTPGEQWPTIVAALMDGFDLLVVQPAGRVRPADARRLAARVRERGAVMVVLGAPGWPEPLDLKLSVEHPEWQGLGSGHGCLAGRRLEVVATGRRVGGRERRRAVWLPAPASGRLEGAGGLGEPGVRLAGVGVAG